MKRIVSFVTLAAMICSLFVGIPNASAADSGKVLFGADFDQVNPKPSALDSNASIGEYDDGNALVLSERTASDDGAFYAIESFSHGNALVKFDIKHNSGYNFHAEIWDSTGTAKNIRIYKNSMTANTWYTYVINPETYTGYRKAAGSTAWEAVGGNVDVIRVNPSGKTYTNTLKLGAGNASTNDSGTWWIDNVTVYDGFPAMSLIMTADSSNPTTATAFSEDFEGSTHKITNGTSNFELIADSEDSENMVLRYRLPDTSTKVLGTASSSAMTYGETIGTGASAFIYPEENVPYTISFNIKVESVNSGDNLWIQTRCVHENTRVGIDLSQFTIGEWYTVSYTLNGLGTDTVYNGKNSASRGSGTKTLKKDGTSSALTINVNTGWTGIYDGLRMTTYNTSGGSYTVDSETKKTPWANVCFQLDDISFTYEPVVIKAEAIMNEASGSFKPVLAAYDEKGIITAVAENIKGYKCSTVKDENNKNVNVAVATAGQSEVGTLAGFAAFAEAEFDITANLEAFQNAKSVKVLYWDSLGNAKPYADAVEIGDRISTAVATSSVETAELEITSDMLPAGATGNYTVVAYAVPFTVAENNIPEYDVTKHILLAVDQKATAFDKITYDASLYNGEEQDIVVVCNAEGSSEAVVTLYEKNDAQPFANISMLLGADITQRNFTWYSLDGGEGKLTYQKKTEMVDGGFTDAATAVTAERCHDDSTYSTKDYYYQNQAVMTGLEPGETYVYQLSNGESKSDMYTIKIGKESSSFSFAFGGDPQVGGNDSATYTQEHEYMGRTIKQMLNADEFDGIDFFLSAGDQIEASPKTLVEDQYDIYLNHDEWATFPMAVTLGNHDAATDGFHMQHFNEPNKLTKADGSYYGASPTTDGAVIDGVDYYYVYNSVLFMHINLNTFDDNSNNLDASRADDKADAEEHAAFIEAVLDETKDNKDILWRVVVCHQSPFGGSYHGNYKLNENGEYQKSTAGNNNYDGRAEQNDYINIREYLLPYLYEADVDLILSGHDHTYTRTHILKPDTTDTDANHYGSVTITPYENTAEKGKNYYTYKDGSTDSTAFLESWTDLTGVKFDGVDNPLIKVSEAPVKVTDPDGFLWVTGSSSSGSQVNSADFPNHYAAVCEKINQRSLIRFDVKPTSIKLTTYNLGTNATENSPLVVIDEFEIEKTNTVAVGGISLDETATIATGQKKTLDATLSPIEPTNKAVNWKSDNEAVATVDENGTVTAISAGTANITATAADTTNGTFSASCAVTVVDAVAITGISLESAVDIGVFTTKTLTAAIEPSNATTKTLSWTSSDESVATVDENGNVTALKPGNATITAAATDGSGKSASCTVAVTYIEMTSFSLNRSTIDMKVMETETLSVSYAPANATYKDVTWTSSAPEIVSVDENGQVEAMKAGTAVITAKNEVGDSASCTVTSVGGVNFVEDFEGADIRLTPETASLWSVVAESDGNNAYAFDGSSLTAISNLTTALSSAMYSTPLADSGYTIAFDYKKTNSGGLPGIEIKTYSHAGEYGCVRFGANDFELNEWYNVKLVYTAGSGWVKYYKKETDTAYSIQTVTAYSSSNHTSGIYYDRIYMAPFYLKSSTEVDDVSKTAFCLDNIKISTPVSATGIELAESSATMEIGDTTAIAPVFAPSNATDTNVAYATSDESVATVNRFGKVTAVGAGTANITVTAADGGYAKTFAVTVKSNEPEITVTKTESGTDWKFEVSANTQISGGKVYIAAYDANDLLISAAIADYGTELTMAQDADASYFRAFIWDENLTPLINSKKFN